MSNWSMKMEGEANKRIKREELEEESDEESSLSADAHFEKFGATAKSMKNEENGNSQESSADREARLRNEVELIHRKLIETGDMTKLRAFLMKKLYQGSWKHAVFNLCSATAAKNEKLTFQHLYSSVQKEAKEKVNEKIKQTMIAEIKNCYYRGSV